MYNNETGGVVGATTKSIHYRTYDGMADVHWYAARLIVDH